MKLIMQGRLAQCYLLSFRVPQEQVRSLLPPGLNLITRETWAFWNVVICRIEKMRPLAFPRSAGFSYNHVAYRLLVECQLRNRSKLSGLYFVRSDADDGLMTSMGNCLTDFKFTQSVIRYQQGIDQFKASVVSGDGKGDLSFSSYKSVTRPLPGTVFTSDRDRAEMLKYHPVGLSTNKNGNEARISEVMRDETNWIENAVEINEFNSQFLRPYEIYLEQATNVLPLNYRWKLGRTLRLAQCHHSKRLSRAMEEVFTL